MGKISHGRLSFACLVMTVLVGHLSVLAVRGQTLATIKNFGVWTNIGGFFPYARLVHGPDGTLYGTTSGGEFNIKGTVFKIQPDGSGFTVLKWFTNTVEGASPYAGMLLLDGVLYGTTREGGSFNLGTVFKMNINGAGYTVMKEFEGLGGGYPEAELAFSGGALYGTTANGTIFRLNTNGSGFVSLKILGGSDGQNPRSKLTLSGNVVYGTTELGGLLGYGTVFKMNNDGSDFTVIKHFGGLTYNPTTSTATNSHGARPVAGVTLSDGVLYGVTSSGGNGGNGTVFRMNANGTDYAVIKHFSPRVYGPDGGPYANNDGAIPSADLFLSYGVIFGTTTEGGSLNCGTVFRMNPDGSDFLVLKHFAFHDGRSPLAGLVASAGVLFGTTAYGGGSSGGQSGGTVFKISASGTGFAVIKYFTDSDGRLPYAGLTSFSNTIYGTTRLGGNYGAGTIFKMNTDGAEYAALKHFSGPDGHGPRAEVTVSGGVLYGTTYHGGSFPGGTPTSGYGTVFRMNLDGTGYTVLKSFMGDDGRFPEAALTVKGVTIFGTTAYGGNPGYGTVFRLNTNGTDFTSLKHFLGNDGRRPFGRLTLAGGTLYGTTYYGGGADAGTVFKLNTNGTGFTSLKVFTNEVHPSGNLALVGGTLYGTAELGGNSGQGTVFRLNTNGSAFTVLKHFEGVDGAYPSGGLIQSGSFLFGTIYSGNLNYVNVFQIHTNGTGYLMLDRTVGGGQLDSLGELAQVGGALYGTTRVGGDFGVGSIFKLDLATHLGIQSVGNAVRLTWTNTAFSLQAAPHVTGGYADIPAGTNSPYTNPVSSSQQFFRLRLR